MYRMEHETYAAISSLELEALAAGDHIQADLCRLAIGGNPVALSDCLEAIAAAKASERPDPAIAYMRASKRRDALEGILWGGDPKKGTPWEGLETKRVAESLKAAQRLARRAFQALHVEPVDRLTHLELIQGRRGSGQRWTARWESGRRHPWTSLGLHDHVKRHGVELLSKAVADQDGNPATGTIHHIQEEKVEVWRWVAPGAPEPVFVDGSLVLL